jgi:hypothetical protein
VYRARDTTLHRDVAIKVLRPTDANDPDHLARFSREAQLLASLNHPNIAHIHGLAEANDVCAFVMELVEGPTLADRVVRGPISINEASLAYETDASGRSEIVVVSFPDPTERLPVSTSGGTQPRWRADGKASVPLQRKTEGIHRVVVGRDVDLPDAGPQRRPVRERRDRSAAGPQLAPRGGVERIEHCGY